MGYEELAHEMIDRECDVLGDRAIDIARNVEGIAVDDDGQVVAIDGDGVEVVGALADEYIDILGKATQASLASIARRYEDEIDIPTNLS